MRPPAAARIRRRAVSGHAGRPGIARNVALYPWFAFFRSLVFWQAVWFLYFQDRLSASEAILLYVVFDVGTTVLEVPSGWMSDRLGRRLTLTASAAAGLAGMVLLAAGDSFAVFAVAQLLMGAGMAFASGTDSALLYESLAATGRGDEVERHELRAWRFSFTALAISAIAGGAMAAQIPELPFVAGALAMGVVLAIAICFIEPAHVDGDIPQGGEVVRLASLRSALTEPVLLWLFALSVVMYGFSHVPFVFGQPFILEALRGLGLDGEAPAVSGAVTTIMMMVSLATSLAAPALRQRLGLAGLLLLAFGMQAALIGVLALSNAAIVIAVLFLRMVPDSLSRPFILARIQPMLGNESRATFLSLQSFTGRLLFATTLYLAALASPGEGQMAYSEIRTVLSWYALGGVACLGILALCARFVRIDPEGSRQHPDA